MQINTVKTEDNRLFSGKSNEYEFMKIDNGPFWKAGPNKIHQEVSDDGVDYYFERK